MKKVSAIVIFLFLSVSSVRASGNADSLNIEQIAFNYFISMLDSFAIDAYSSYKFNKSRDKMYYTGTTNLFDDLVLGNFKTYTFKKKKFINAGSFNDRNTLLSCDKTNKPLVATDKFLVKLGGKTPAPKERKAGDAHISISNRYFHDEHYFVRIKIEHGDQAFNSYFYVKMDATGAPVNWVVASEGEG